MGQFLYLCAICRNVETHSDRGVGWLFCRMRPRLFPVPAGDSVIANIMTSAYVAKTSASSDIEQIPAGCESGGH